MSNVNLDTKVKNNSGVNNNSPNRPDPSGLDETLKGLIGKNDKDKPPEQGNPPSDNSLSSTNKGDVNGDGKIDAKDLTEIIKISKDENADPTTSKYNAADFNDDGIVDADDIKLMKKRLKGPKGGDFNYDGNVDQDDLNKIKDFIAGKTLFTESESKAVGGKTGAAKYIAELEKRFKERAKGDVNGDGKIDDEDIKLATSALYGGYVLTDAEKDAADYDENGGFKREDLAALQKLLKPRVKGDINGDGKLNQDDLNILNKLDEVHILSEEQKKAADMDGDGKFDKEKDLKILLKRFEAKSNGDINADGKVDSNDVNKLKAIINNKELLTDAEKSAFDFDGDKTVDEKDIAILEKRFEKRTKKGDINGDGVVNQKDLDMMDAYFKGDLPFTAEEFKAADMNNDGELKAHNPSHPDDAKNDFYQLSKLIADEQDKKDHNNKK